MADTARVTLRELLADPEAYVNRQVEVTAPCVHLCRHGARKVFLSPTVRGQDDSLVRCEASAQMVGPFPAGCVGKTVRLVGIVREDILDEAGLHRLQEDHAARQALIAQEVHVDSADVPHEQRCPTEQASTGQAGLDDFNDQVADYRRRIAQRQAREGKNYLSLFYIETSSCRLAEDGK